MPGVPARRWRSLLLRVLLLTLVGSTACKKDESAPVISTPPVTIPPSTATIAVDSAVVYEAYVRDCSAAGTFAGLQARLDSIKSLGCNVLWLMPVHPIGQLKRVGALGSPYSVRDYQAVNAEHGTMVAFDQLVAAAHDRKMVVILDWVANHTAWDNPWITQHPEWYTKDSGGQIMSPAGTGWLDVADLDFSKTEMRREMIRAMRFWVQQHRVDGFRCDAADMVPDDFWKEAIDSLQRVRSDLFWLAEGNKVSHYTSGFQLTFGWGFYDALKQVFNQNATATTLTTTHNRELQGAPAGRYRLRFTTNHDYTFTEGPAPEVFRSPEAAKAAYVATLAYGATPMMYSGQEAGYPARLSLFEKRTIQWGYSPATTTFYRGVLGLYHTLPALRTGSVAPASVAPGVVAVLRTGSATQARVAVLVNTRNQPVTIALPATWPVTTWTNALTGQPAPATPTITLAAYEYAIWRSQ